MKQHLFYIDKNWEYRGYARNYNLIINFECKTYKIYINPFMDYEQATDIEVKKKKDILNYISYLKENGFTEVEEI